jgi:hypothetical protein
VDGTAHIDAAAYSNSEMIRQLGMGEMIVHTIHNGFYKTGCISGSAVAVDPTLGMHDIRDGMSCPAHREPHVVQRAYDQVYF